MNNDTELTLDTIEVANVSTIEAQERASVDVQIATAKRYPRNLSAVKQAMIGIATLDQETAESCFYTLPRGGKSIEGPSIRLAEIAVSCYQNLRAGSRVLSIDTSSATPHVVIQAVAHDLQNNICITVEKRRRITKKKSKGSIDEDDINLAANAGSAIAFRDAVLKVIPGALIKPVYNAAKSCAVGDAKTLSVRREQAIATLMKFPGLTKERILSAAGVKTVEEIGLPELELLFGLKTSVKDGHQSLDEAFPEVQKATKPTQEHVQPPAETTKPKPTTFSPREQLQAVVSEAGFDFTSFKTWAVKEGFMPADDKSDCFSDIPDDLAKRLLRAQTGMLNGIAQVRGGAQ